VLDLLRQRRRNRPPLQRVRRGGTLVFSPVTLIRNAWGKVRDGALRAFRAPGAWFAKARARVAKATERPRARVWSVRNSAREHPTMAVGIVGGALVGIAWIAWAIYVTANNGANAGLGVLITWPVVIGALALVAAPFVLTARLVQRHRDASEPAMAGAPSIAEEPAKKAEKAEKKESENDERAEKKAEAEEE
jgi:hypothetical protein